MKNTPYSFLTVALALAAGLSFNAAAATNTLNVGDPAPKLQTGKFVQGDPVTEFAPGKAYIVEFWATWCGPCRASIPHLNETSIKFKDKGLIVIGQDCSEPDESKVAPFVKSMGESMTYRVALDNKEGGGKGKMAETWMKAAARNSIPTAFLIDTTGHIAWIGHPMSLKEKTIEDVLAGTFNAKETAAEEEKQEAELQALERRFQAAMQDGNWDAALSDLDELEKVAPDGMADALASARLKVLFSKKDYPAGYKLITQLGDAHKDDPMTENNLAWMIISDKSIEHPDFDLAIKLARRATDGAKEPAQKSMFLDTLARAKFMQGSKQEGIALEQKALALAGDKDKEKLQKTLDSYNRGELPNVE
jgi:thiol-disulfide isomerase/thioredoxin